MLCENCGKEIPDTAIVCPECGTRLTAEPIPAPASSGTDDIKSKLGGGVFVDADEKIVATLKNGVLLNILSGEGLQGEDAILSNKRLYYNHKRGLISFTRVEEKIDVADITGTKITDRRPRGILILAILIAVASVLIGVAADQIPEALIGLPIALLFFIIYLISVKKFLKIEYAGGCIHFSVKGYKMENVRMFQKSIHALKDQLR